MIKAFCLSFVPRSIGKAIVWHFGICPSQQMYIVSLVPYSESISYRKEVPQGPFNRRQFLARL